MGIDEISMIKYQLSHIFCNVGLCLLCIFHILIFIFTYRYLGISDLFKTKIFKCLLVTQKQPYGYTLSLKVKFREN